ncbi:MAG: putative hemolysin [Verrucomicrobiales bacterium]|jgi:putative hemolysin
MALVVVGALLFCVSALESALFALREHRIPTIASENTRLSATLRGLLATKQARLGQVLVLSALCNVGMAALGLRLVQEIAAPSERYLTGLAVFGGLVVACHLIPNLVASLRPRWVFTALTPIVVALTPIVVPFERLLHASARAMTNLIVPQSIQPNESMRDDELGTLVEMRRDEGALEDLEGEVIHEILKLGDKVAKDCMTPRVDTKLLSINLPPAEAARRISEQSHRLLPVYDGTPDEIIGVLDVLAYLHSGGEDIRAHIRPPTFVPETLGAIDLFQRHLRGEGDLVVVLDEFGGLEGIVTKTDIVEHLVGDVAPSEDAEIQVLGRARFLVSGSARLDELREVTGVDLETDGLDTIGGLIATSAGRIPSPGETLRLEPFRVTIRKSTGKRVEELLLVTIGGEESLEEGGES